jgi:hypothetical protein
MIIIILEKSTFAVNNITLQFCDRFRFCKLLDDGINNNFYTIGVV